MAFGGVFACHSGSVLISNGGWLKVLPSFPVRCWSFDSFASCSDWLRAHVILTRNTKIVDLLAGPQFTARQNPDTRFRTGGTKTIPLCTALQKCG